jgi:hypothetical protein
VPATDPSAESFITLESPKFATQSAAPSKAMPKGPSPTRNVARATPFAALSFVTVSLS